MTKPTSLTLCVCSVLIASAPLLAQSPSYSFHGASGDAAGSSVALAGDVDADGLADILVGSPSGAGVVPGAGHVHVYSGADGSQLYLLQGQAIDDAFGIAVAGAGDVDGDGFADVIVGAPGNDTNGAGAGQATVFSGFDGSVLYTFDGAAATAALGTSVAGAGDVDEDGFADVIVGSPGDDTNGLDAGSAKIFSGRTGAVLLMQHGATAGDNMGRSVAGAGDLNGDCADDVLIGSPGASYSGATSGRIHAISGKTRAILFRRDGGAGDQLGYSVCGAGDVDADGSPDFIAGSPAASYSGAGSGRAIVYSGLTGNPIRTVDGSNAGDNLGFSVCGAGDVDNDGNADFAVGSPAADSQYLDSGRARIYSGADLSILRSIKGSNNAESAGYSVQGGADVNGDGYPDLVVGAPASDVNGPGSGSAMVYALPPFAQFGSGTETTGDFDVNVYGFEVNNVGDIDGDTVPDYIVGATGGFVRIHSGADDSTIRTILAEEGFAEEFGHGVDGAGDVNGDGTPDFIVGGPHYSALVPNGGHTVVYSGLDGSKIYEWFSTFNFAHHGESVAGGDDVDGDGTPDLIYGVVAAFSTRAGAIGVRSGATGALLYSFAGLATQDLFGWSVDMCGDIDGDGFADFLGTSSNNGTILGTGYVIVYSGQTGSVLYQFNGDDLDDRFGFTARSGEDVNGDGVPDIAVGAPWDDNNGDKSGLVRVFSGADGSVLYNFEGIVAGDEMGKGVALGDVNGDGFADILAGAQGFNAGAGRVFVFSGVDGSLMQSFDGNAGWYGRTIALLRDTDGDGYGEVLVGAATEVNGGIGSGSVHRYNSEVESDPGIFRSYGRACTVTNGSLPRVRGTGRPVLGDVFDVELTSAQPGVAVSAGFGIIQTNIPFGFPIDGCVVLTLPKGSVPMVTDASGKASVGGLPVPVLPVLVGQSLYAQWLIFDATANPVGLATSNAICVTIGQ